MKVSILSDVHIRYLSIIAVALAAGGPLASAMSEREPVAVRVRGPIALNQPIAVYNNWSAYDELSDNVELTEELAMKQLQQILRLRRLGVRIDYYVMDAFWYSPTAGYREFRKPHWPDGPERWLKACRDNQIRPGLWVACNVPFRLPIRPEWRSSMDATGSAMCFFDGGFLRDFIDTLQFWHDRGVRLFKFDFANLSIATPEAAKRYSKEEIFSRNAAALRDALLEFKKRKPEVLLAAFNGFGGDMEGTAAPIRQTVDLRWLGVFDSLYCGDPRPADVPAFNLWRSKDIYTDHMVRYYEANGVPLERIDNTGFMVGKTGTCYRRQTAAWQGMLLLEHARGGWMNVYYGNLELLDTAKARWFAKVQQLYFPLQAFGRTYCFGGLPGRIEPYGFCSVGAQGSLYTVVNPSQAMQVVRLPRVNLLQPELQAGRIQFRDAGFEPRLSGHELMLGPEQMAVVGFGEYSRPNYSLGIQADVVIPQDIQPLKLDLQSSETNSITGTVDVPAHRDVRVVMRQSAEGKPVRTSGGAPPNGTSMGKLLKIEASQQGHPLEMQIHYDREVWSGLSWAAGEIKAVNLKPGVPIKIRGLSSEKRPVDLELQVYSVRY